LESIAAAHNLGPAVKVKIGFAIIAALFDYSLKVHEIQKVQYWIKLVDKINEMLNEAITSKDILTVSGHNINFISLETDKISRLLTVIVSYSYLMTD